MKTVHFFFLDASALTKRYAPERGSLLLDHRFANVALDRLYVFNVGMAEVASILVRKKNTGLISTTAFSRAIAEFVSEIVHSPSVHKVVADNPVVTTAIALVEKHAINATDAILLRSALELTMDLLKLGNDLVLVASDQRLLRAGQAEGLTTFDPESQTQPDLDALL